MKSNFWHLFILFFATWQFAFAQDDSQALEYIKTGNTLREAGQYERSEEFFKKGLAAVKGKNQYWEATAYEGLGLLYRNMSLTEKAIQSFNAALDIYKELRNETSIHAITSLLESVEEKERIYAGIEIGAKGVKLSVVGIRLTIDGFYDFTIKHDESFNANIVQMTEQSVQDAIKAANGFLDVARKKYELDDKHIFVVASSGVKQVAEQKGKLDEIKKKFTENIKTKNPIRFISAEEESYYVIMGTTMPKFRANSTTIDIGSGNTKGGFLSGERLEKLEAVTFDFGTETFSHFIEENKYDRLLGYDSLAKVLAKERIYPAVQKEYARHGGLRTRQMVNLVGGITWTVATFMYPENALDPFVPISPYAVRRFRNDVIKQYELVTAPNLEYITDEPLRLAAQENVKRAKASFTREEMIAGAIILDAVVNSLASETSGKKFYYARYGYIGWITGYVMEAVTKEYAKLDE
jgi:tetratricopeptide (TPR) repeat protein